jgi:YVTN family beta-propeller protein
MSSRAQPRFVHRGVPRSGRREAEKVLRAALGRADAGDDLIADETTVSEFAERWFDHRKKIDQPRAPRAGWRSRPTARPPTSPKGGPAPVGSVATIDVKTRTKHPTDIPVGANPIGVAFTPDGKTAFVANPFSGTVSTIDVKTRTKHPTDVAVGANPIGVAVTPCRR